MNSLRFHLPRWADRWLKKPLIPALVMVILGSCWFFIEIAEKVSEQETRHFDEKVLLAMRERGNTADPIGPPRVEEMARDLTALGGFILLTGITFTACSFALFAGWARLAGLGLVSVVVGSSFLSLLKHGFDRPRPALVEHGTWVYSSSFPSGHSMMSALVYLTLGILLARTQTKKRVRIFIVFISVLTTLLVGVSRVYLGVHWPTDVLAGWALGGAWAILFWLVAMKIDPQPPAR